MCQIWILKGLFIMTCWKESLLHSNLKSLACGSKSICSWHSGGVKDNFGPWRIIGRKWALQLDILHRLLISIGVQHTFLWVILGFSSGLHCNCGVLILWAIYWHWDHCLPVIYVLVENETDIVPFYDHVCSFQALFHHCSVCLLKHIATTLQREKL